MRLLLTLALRAWGIVWKLRASLTAQGGNGPTVSRHWWAPVAERAARADISQSSSLRASELQALRSLLNETGRAYLSSCADGSVSSAFRECSPVLGGKACTSLRSSLFLGTVHHCP